MQCVHAYRFRRASAIRAPVGVVAVVVGARAPPPDSFVRRSRAKGFRITRDAPAGSPPGVRPHRRRRPARAGRRARAFPPSGGPTSVGALLADGSGESVLPRASGAPTRAPDAPASPRHSVGGRRQRSSGVRARAGAFRARSSSLIAVAPPRRRAEQNGSVPGRRFRRGAHGGAFFVRNAPRPAAHRARTRHGPEFRARDSVAARCFAVSSAQRRAPKLSSDLQAANAPPRAIPAAINRARFREHHARHASAVAPMTTGERTTAPMRRRRAPRGGRRPVRGARCAR